jgi:adenylate cyclase
MGGALFNAGRYEEAIPLWEKSGRLNPLPSVWYFRNLGLFYWFTGRYEEAIVASNKALQINPDDIITFRNLAAIYAVLGKEEKAHAAAAQILRLNPNFSIERHFKNMPWKDREGKERYMDALRKAGLPDGKSSLPLPDKPSIAVLPFVNMSDDPKQEYFSDGLTEEIITALSKVRNMFVIARNSTFTYKDKAVMVKQVAEELGVRYVLEGSVRKSENRLRITTQLIDAVKGHHMWAERYDLELKDIFGIQDEITKKIIIALQIELTEGEQARIYGKGTDNFEAYEKFLRGLEYFLRFNEGDNVMARQAAEEAIALDPEYAAAYVMLGSTHLVDLYLGKSSKNSMEQALEAAQKALSLDEHFPPVHNLLGAIYRSQQQWEKAIAEGKRAIALNPNYARGHVGLAETMLYAGRFEEAIELVKKAMCLNPYYHPRYVFILGLSFQMAGHHEEALKTSKEYLTRCEKGEGDPLWAHIGLTEAYMKLGREEEAHAHAAEVLKINPYYSLERVRESLRFKDPKHTESYLDALRKAGLPH